MRRSQVKRLSAVHIRMNRALNVPRVSHLTEHGSVRTNFDSHWAGLCPPCSAKPYQTLGRGNVHCVYLNLTKREYLFLCVLSSSSPVVDLVWSCWSAIDPLLMICPTHVDLSILLIKFWTPLPPVTHTVCVSLPNLHLMVAGEKLDGSWFHILVLLSFPNFYFRNQLGWEPD